MLDGDGKAMRLFWPEVQRKARDNARTPVQVQISPPIPCWHNVSPVAGSPSNKCSHVLQWNASANAGFSTATPWMKVNDDFPQRNAKLQDVDPESILQYWRHALRVRKKHARSLVHGTFHMHGAEDPSVMCFSRSSKEGKGQALVVLNFTKEHCEWVVPVEARSILRDGRAVLSNYDAGSLPRSVNDDGGRVSLRPFEAFVLGVEV